MIGADYTGTVLDDKFEVIRLLGEGGMGAVYLARHKTINKPVAVKFLHAALAGKEEVVKRFYREAQAAAAIRHSNIIDVMDLGVSPKGEPYIVMEYLEGEGLAGRIDQGGPLSLPAACGVVEAALLALDAAHEKGIVHRDLKPDNIFLVRRRGELPGVKLIDFGISKFVSVPDQTKITQDGSMLGTPAYMSPEQARGLDGVDHRTDLYAMGVIFYEILTGEVPFKGATYSELLLNMLTTEPRDPSTVNPKFPEEARPVLMKALEKDPANRYQSAKEMLEAVRALAPLAEKTNDLGDLALYLERRVRENPSAVEPIETGETQFSDELLSEMLKKRSLGQATPGTAEHFIASAKQGLTVLMQNGEAVINNLQQRGVFDKLKIPYLWFLEKTAYRPKVRIGTYAALGVLIVMLGAALCSEGDVRITVSGAPTSAKIFFNDAETAGNPFEVPFSEDPFPLRVETADKRAFEISIVPSRDQTIEVHLDSASPSKAGALSKKAEPKETVQKKSAEPKKETATEEKSGASNETSDESATDKPKKRRFRFEWPTRRKK